MQHNYLYLIQPERSVFGNEDVYKIGMTQRTPGERLNEYGKSALPITFILVDDAISDEKLLIDIFDHKYIKAEDYGAEYYHGDPFDMIDTIHTFQHEHLIGTKYNLCKNYASFPDYYSGNKIEGGDVQTPINILRTTIPKTKKRVYMNKRDFTDEIDKIVHSRMCGCDTKFIMNEALMLLHDEDYVSDIYMNKHLIQNFDNSGAIDDIRLCRAKLMEFIEDYRSPCKCDNYSQLIKYMIDLLNEKELDREFNELVDNTGKPGNKKKYIAAHINDHHYAVCSIVSNNFDNNINEEVMNIKDTLMHTCPKYINVFLRIIIELIEHGEVIDNEMKQSFKERFANILTYPAVTDNIYNIILTRDYAINGLLCTNDMLKICKDMLVYA